MFISFCLFYFEGVLCVYTHYTPTLLNYYDVLHLPLIYAPSRVFKYELPCFSVPALFSCILVSSLPYLWEQIYVGRHFSKHVSDALFFVDFWNSLLKGWALYLDSKRQVCEFCQSPADLLPLSVCSLTLTGVIEICLAKFCSLCLWKCLFSISMYLSKLSQDFIVTTCISSIFSPNKSQISKHFHKIQVGFSGAYFVLA